MPSEHYRAGPCELSGEDGHGHEARDLATADQVRGELCLLVRVRVGGVLDRFLDEERRIGEPVGVATNNRFAVLADVRRGAIRAHSAHDVDGEPRTNSADEPVEVSVDRGGLPARVRENGCQRLRKPG